MHVLLSLSVQVTSADGAMDDEAVVCSTRLLAHVGMCLPAGMLTHLREPLLQVADAVLQRPSACLVQARDSVLGVFMTLMQACREWMPSGTAEAGLLVLQKWVRAVDALSPTEHSCVPFLQRAMTDWKVLITSFKVGWAVQCTS